MSIPLQRFRQISFLSACLAVSFSPCRATACGPFFPDEVIPAGDGRVLDLPAGDFEAEMIRLLPTEKSPLHAVETFGKDKFISVFDLSAKVDEADLRTTLQARQMDAAAIDKLVASYADVRAQLTARAEAVEEQKDNGKPIDQLPNMVPPIIPLGLPVEFNDYLRGLVAYHLGDLDTARIAWSDLLKLPATQRQFRSTWATFMLGKSYLAQDPAKAGEWFAKTRDLAAAGFSDSLGLASSSLGWQAKADLSQHQFAAAIDLYLKQLATGDSSAAMSLRDSARAVLATGGDALVDAARDDLCRRVITAYVLCDAGPYRFMSDKEKALIPRWLTAVESNAPQNMPGADRLAWAAYRSGDFI